MVWKYRENGTINHCRHTKVHAHAKLIPVFPQRKSNALYMLWKKRGEFSALWRMRSSVEFSAEWSADCRVQSVEFRVQCRVHCKVLQCSDGSAEWSGKQCIKAVPGAVSDGLWKLLHILMHHWIFLSKPICTALSHDKVVYILYFVVVAAWIGFLITRYRLQFMLQLQTTINWIQQKYIFCNF